MKKTKKIAALLLATVMLVSATVAVTVAYLTSSATAVNTFTVGDVVIDLDEADVDEFGNVVTSERVKENEYKLLPGHTYVKDPTVTVEAESEDCYVRILVTVNDISKLKAAFPVADYPEWYNEDLFLVQKLVTDWSNDVWEYKGFDNSTYEFWYVGPKANAEDVVKYSATETVLEPLFTNVVIPGTVDNDHLEYLDEATITIVAHAIQADGFTDLNADGTAADEAWAHF